MQVDIRLAEGLDHPVLRRAIERHTRVSLSRLSSRFSMINVRVQAPTAREGGQSRCRISAELRSGGTLHGSAEQTHPHQAVDAALRNIRRMTRRTLERRSRSRSRRVQLSDRL